MKALPTLDAEGALLGMVTLHDFLVDPRSPDDARRMAKAPARVGDIMSSPVLTAHPEQAVVDLVSAFSDGGRHHLPVVDAQRRLVGMLTQSDMVAALYRAGLERAGA